MSNTSTYSAYPDDLSDLLTYEQAAMLARWLRYVMEHKHGSITLTVANGHVHRIQFMVSEMMPNPFSLQ